MPNFKCILDLSTLPAEAKRGSTLSAVVKVTEASAPVRSVTIAVEAYGVSQRLKKMDENTFLLELRVPVLVPPGHYAFTVRAANDNGELNEKQTGSVVVR